MLDYVTDTVDCCVKDTGMLSFQKFLELHCPYADCHTWAANQRNQVRKFCSISRFIRHCGCLSYIR